jgi:glycine betaine/proline transport system permease protein
MALIGVGCLFGIGLIGAWTESMTTLSIVLTAILFCSAVGIPIGILASRSDRFAAVLRPVLDLMQTIPSFVYLVPVVMLFGIGNVPGVIVTIVYALSPIIRLTNLGIRQVRPDMVEAARAFGASPLQILFKVQIPLAAPTIMAGLNQTIMMSLAMVVVASMISVTGLGEMVLRGIGRLDMGIATVGGFGIVLLAIAIDRTTQGFGRSSRERGRRKWYEVGPIGMLFGFYYMISGKLEPTRPNPESPVQSHPSLGLAVGVVSSTAKRRTARHNAGE